MRGTPPGRACPSLFLTRGTHWAHGASSRLGRGQGVAKWSLKSLRFLASLFYFISDLLTSILFLLRGTTAEAIYKREKFLSMSSLEGSMLSLTFIHYHIKKTWQGHSGGKDVLNPSQFALAFETKCIYWASNYINNKRNKRGWHHHQSYSLSKPFSFQILICRPWNTSIHWFLNVITTVKIRLHIMIFNLRTPCKHDPTACMYFISKTKHMFC